MAIPQTVWQYLHAVSILHATLSLPFKSDTFGGTNGYDLKNGHIRLEEAVS